MSGNSGGASTALIAMGLNLASSIASGYAEKKEIEAANEAKKAAWEDAMQDTRDQITIAFNRTLTRYQEINRDKILAIQSAEITGMEKVGQAEVSAAQLGITGNRGSTKASSYKRVIANAKSDAYINKQIESINATNYYSDNAKRAIYNLSAQAPTYDAEPSWLNIGFDAVSGTAKSYTSLSSSQRADVKSSIFGIFGSSGAGSAGSAGAASAAGESGITNAVLV